MTVNTPLGVLEFSDALENYGYRSVDTSKPLKKLEVQTFENEKEVLWYKDADNRAIIEISWIKNNSQDYMYTCECGYELTSGFNLESIQCHECGKLMTKSYIGLIAKVV